MRLITSSRTENELTYNIGPVTLRRTATVSGYQIGFQEFGINLAVGSSFN